MYQLILSTQKITKRFTDVCRFISQDSIPRFP